MDKVKTFLKKAFCLLITSLMLFSSLGISILADEFVAEIDGVKYKNVEDTWNAVKRSSDDVTVNMLSDWDLRSYEYLEILENHKVTINMNGYCIDRNVNDEDETRELHGEGDGEAFRVQKNATLVIYGGDTSKVHYGYIYNSGSHIKLWVHTPSNSNNTTDAIYGGLITGGACDDSSGAGAIAAYDEGATIELHEVTIAGNISDEYGVRNGQGGAIGLSSKNNTLKMYNTKIMYNYAEGRGGAIYVNHDDSSVTLDNSYISYNYSDEYGGAIYSTGQNTTIKLENNSKIDHNYADIDGGAIYINQDNGCIKSDDGTAVISNNEAKEDGGAIRLDDANGKVKNITLSNNKASDEGGAIYVNDDSCTVESCKIFNNTANKGGGIYAYDEFTLNNCTIKENKSTSEGGGIYVDDTTVYLAGTIYVQDNTKGDNEKSDIYLEDGGYIKNMPNKASYIGVKHENGTANLTEETGSYSATVFFADVDGLCVEWSNENAYLRLEKGQQQPKYEPERETITDTTAKETDFTYNGYPVIRGYFLSQSGTRDLASAFYYSDGYFLSGEDANNSDPSIYNTHLASASYAMAMAGGSSSVGKSQTDLKNSGRSYTYRSQNIRKFLTDIGAEEVYVSDSFAVKPTTTSVSLAVAKKEIAVDEKTGKKIILVPVAVRGIDYEAEWASSLYLGTSGEALGFAQSADKVKNYVDEYLVEQGLATKSENGENVTYTVNDEYVIKFWVVGFSRGGAIANLTAKRLIDSYCANDSEYNDSTYDSLNTVYAYPAEAPRGGASNCIEQNHVNSYNWIHNMINQSDIVPLLAPVEMGFIRYGVDHFIPGSESENAVVTTTKLWNQSGLNYTTTGTPSYNQQADNKSWGISSSDYKQQREKMLKQLEAVDPGLLFDDYFTAATFNLVSSQIPLIKNFYDQIEPLSSNLTEQQFIRIFMRAVQAWGLKLESSSDFDFRKAYSETGYPYYNKTIDYAVQDAMNIFFSKTEEEQAGLSNAISNTLSNLGSDAITVWWNFIGDWHDSNDYEKNVLFIMLWHAALETENNGVKGVDYLKPIETLSTMLPSDTEVIIDFAMSLVDVDYRFDADQWDETPNVYDWDNECFNILEGITTANGLPDSSLCLLGTFGYNYSVIMQAHEPQVNFAWVRSYDSFYDNDLVYYTIDDEIVTTKVEDNVEGEEVVDKENWYWNQATLTFDVLDQNSEVIDGASVFYKVTLNDGEESEWLPYNKALELVAPENDGETNKYSIQTTAIYSGRYIDVTTRTIYVTRCTHTDKTIVEEKESTCLEQGWDEYQICDKCSQLFDSEGNVIDSIPYKELGDHDYPASWDYIDEYGHAHVCTRSQEHVDTVYEHEFEWIIDKEATKDHDGLKHEECKDCHYKREAVIIPAKSAADTGDHTNLMLCFAIMIVSASSAMFLYNKKKKRILAK